MPLGLGYNERMSGAGEKILILDRGVVELAYPREWTVKANPAGHLELKDPSDSATLEISYLKVPPLGPDAPKVEDLLRGVLPGTEGAGSAGSVATAERGTLRRAWATYPFEADDTEKGLLRKAFGRWMIGGSGSVFVLMTYYYWADDAAWAVPAWEGMAESLRVEGAVAPASRTPRWTERERGSMN